jgi:hypothetical protein
MQVEFFRLNGARAATVWRLPPPVLCLFLMPREVRQPPAGLPRRLPEF